MYLIKSINESKFAFLVPISWCINKFYNYTRQDWEGKNGRGKGHGGDGNLFFVKKDYLIKKVELLHEIKSIS